jgi:nucleoside-diphosphate-sugar epimerase
MRIVVIGATGNVGTSTVESLAGDQQITSVLGLARRLPEYTVEKTEWAQADVTETELVPILRGADAVIHLAWIFQPTHQPAVTWQTNVIGSARVFKAAADAQVPVLVCASSVGAYSPGPKDRAVDESWPTHGWPGAAYSREKAYTERMLDNFEARHPDIRVVRLRPGFIFKREAAAEQRRLFAGPLLPSALARPGLIPVVPDIPGLKLQALHSADAGEAYRLAVVRGVGGAFNIAADPVLDVPELARILNARPVRVPARGVRAAIAAGWHMGLLPADPKLFDMALKLPVMDTSRARSALGWSPRHSSSEAVREFLSGLQSNAGMSTPPLDPRTAGPLRLRELMTGAGRRP